MSLGSSSPISQGQPSTTFIGGTILNNLGLGSSSISSDSASIISINTAAANVTTVTEIVPIFTSVSGTLVTTSSTISYVTSNVRSDSKTLPAMSSMKSDLSEFQPSSTSVSTSLLAGSKQNLTRTFSTEAVPTGYEGDSTGLVTDRGNITWTIVPTIDYITETGVDFQSSTITVSFITTFLMPSAIGSTNPPIPSPAATLYFKTPPLTTQSLNCLLIDRFNPFLKTSSCSIAPIWTSMSRTYDPWCALDSDGSQKCLCPICTRPQKECLDLELPTPGHCPEGFLCSLSQPSGIQSVVWDWPTTPNYDLPWCATRWDEYVTCITAHDKSSCSSVTYYTTIESSTSTDSNGTVWIMPFFAWTCPDALCRIDTFKLPWPFGWIKFILTCAFKDQFSCITWSFHGFPPAPKFDFPPIGPPPDDWVLEPTPVSTWVDGTEFPVSTLLDHSANTPYTSVSSCSERTLMYTTRYCITVSASNTTTMTSCSDILSTMNGCTRAGSITTSIIPCSTRIQTGVSLNCLNNYTNSADCTTNTPWTYSGCSATTSTSLVIACPFSFELDYSAIDSTLSAWLARLIFTLPDYTLVSTGSLTHTSFTSSTVQQPGSPSLSRPKTVSFTSNSGSPLANTTTSILSHAKTLTTSKIPFPPEVSKSASSLMSSDTILQSVQSDLSKISQASSRLSSFFSEAASKSSASHLSPQSTSVPVVAPACEPNGRQAIYFDVFREPRQQTFVPLDGKTHFAQSQARDIACSFVDPVANNVTQICHICEDKFTGIGITTPIKDFDGCNFTIINDKKLYTFDPHDLKDFIFTLGAQLETVTCRSKGK